MTLLFGFEPKLSRSIIGFFDLEALGGRMYLGSISGIITINLEMILIILTNRLDFILVQHTGVEGHIKCFENKEPRFFLFFSHKERFP